MDRWQVGRDDAAASGSFRRKQLRLRACNGSRCFSPHPTRLARSPIMSDNDAASNALGKRARDSADDVEGNGGAPDVPDMPAEDLNDSSDEEIGPMPVAEEADGAAENGKGRKKRKRAGKCWEASCSLA